MVDNSIALGIKPPEFGGFNPLQAMLVASQIRSAQNQDQLAQLGIAEKTTQANALADYRSRVASGQPNPDEALAGTPDVMARVVQTRAMMKEDERKTLDDNMLRNAQAAQRVLALPAGDERTAAWQEELNAALKDKRINPLQYERMKTLPPDEKTLTPIVKAGLSIEQQITLEQKEKDRATSATDMAALTTQVAGKPAPSAAPSTSSYFDTLKKAESAGSVSARPPLDPATGRPASTATGLYQFTDGTWSDLVSKRPDLELTPEGRTDPKQQERAIKAFTASNAVTLLNADLPPTDRNLYMAHFLGADGATRFLAGMKANPSAPATSLVSPEAVAANKSVFFDSAGQPKSAVGVYNSLTNKFGDATSGVTGTAPASAADSVWGDRDRALKVAMAVAGRESSTAPARAVATEVMKSILGEQKTNINAEVEARRLAAISQGEDMKSERVKSYILTGKMPKEDQMPLSATDKKAIMEADEGVLMAQSSIGALKQAKVLSKVAYAGPTAGIRGYTTSLVGAEGGVATQELDNLVTSNALSQLKAIFGAAPTEGERKILLDIQGSVSKSDAVRQKIYDRAIQMADIKLDFNKQRANELRGGDFYKTKLIKPVPTDGTTPETPAAPAASTIKAETPPPPAGFTLVPGKRSAVDTGDKTVMSDAETESVTPGAQYAQASGPYLISIQGGGRYSVVDQRTGQVRYTGTLDGARQAQAQLMSSGQ